MAKYKRDLEGKTCSIAHPQTYKRPKVPLSTWQQHKACSQNKWLRDKSLNDPQWPNQSLEIGT